LEEGQKEKGLNAEEFTGLIEKNFLTESGRKLARSIFLTTEIAENAEKNI
jgi:hypothetical protein